MMKDLGLKIPACNPSTLAVDAGGLGVQSHPQLHRKFEAILGHMRSCFQNEVSEA